MKFYENLSADLSAFFEAVNAERAKNVAEANIIADEARALISRAQVNLARHEALCEVVSATQESLKVENDNLRRIVGNVRDAMKDLYESDLPECPVEQFAGYCEVCGEPVLEGSEKYSPEGDLLCSSCEFPVEEEEEDPFEETEEDDVE